VINGANLIMMSVPGPGHEAYAKALAPYLQPGQVVFMNPGHSGGALHLANTLAIQGKKDTRVADTNTLSYISRVVKPGTVRVSSHNKSVLLSVFPASYLQEVTSEIHQYFPALVSVDNVLITSLSNINAICHPPGMILNAGWLEATRGDFRFYYDGITPSVGRVIDLLDMERVKIGQAYGVKILSFPELFYLVGSTDKKAVEENSCYLANHLSEPNQFIKAPAKLDDRYMHEDLNFGLVPISVLGKLAGVACPVIDSLIQLGCSLMNRNYWDEGLGLTQLGLAGLTKEQVQSYLQQGRV
jgi:opine dehydrogenase